MKAHTELKDLRSTGTKLRNFHCLVPGAGLEPARTLPGPRDFKSRFYYLQQTLAGRKALYQRGLLTSCGVFLPVAASWLSYTVSYREGDLGVAWRGERFFNIRDDCGITLSCQVEQRFCVLHSAVNFHDALEVIFLWPVDNNSVFKDSVFPGDRITQREKEIILGQRHLDKDSHGAKLVQGFSFFKHGDRGLGIASQPTTTRRDETRNYSGIANPIGLSMERELPER
jgi:hypothetical protein